MKQYQSNIFYVMVLSLSSLFLSSCEDVSLKGAMFVAGDNKQELKKVINHYKEIGDDEKLLAAYYLIKNMPDKEYALYKPFNHKIGEEIRNFDLFKFNDLDTIQQKVKQLEDSLCSAFSYFEYKRIKDIKVITAEYLIENIDYAFKVWEMPWARHLTREQFYEYILPYRLDNEPLDRWRKESYEAMTLLIDSIGEGDSLLQICCMTNDFLKKEFGFKYNELEKHPGLLSYSEVKKMKGGRCYDMNLITAYRMRAIGIPVTNEFVPAWGHSNFGGHAWLSVLLEDGIHAPFNSLSENPIRGQVPFRKQDKICKAYRKPFDIRKAKSYSGSKALKSVLGDYCYDITSEYVETKTVKIKTKDFNPLTKSNVKLGVLREEYWNAVGCGELTRGKDSIVFNDLGLEVIYIGFVNRQSIVSDPFFITAEGGVKYLIANNQLMEYKANINMNDYWWFRKDREYILTYWDNGWKELAQPYVYEDDAWSFSGDTKNIEIKDSIAIYNNIIPENALLRFQNRGSERDIGSFGRPFLINEEVAVYY